MLSYYFKIWQNIEKDERGSIWQRFAANAPFSAKIILVVLILCLLGVGVSTLLPSDIAAVVQIVIIAFSLALSFIYSIMLNKLKRKSALGDLGSAIDQVERIRRKFVAQAGLTADTLVLVLEESHRFAVARREARKTFTDRAYTALIAGVFVSLFVKLTDISNDPLGTSLAASLFVMAGFAAIVLMSLAGPLWDLADLTNEMPLESVELFTRDIALMVMIERGCKPQNEKRARSLQNGVARTSS